MHKVNSRSSKILELLNNDMPEAHLYIDAEIINAFSKSNYSSGTPREQLIYFEFFEKCNNEECLKELCETYKAKIRDVKQLYISCSTEDKKSFGVFWEKRFRLGITIDKEVYEIIPRSDDKYLEIDNFQIYELTPSIAYEMAIRNNDLLNLIERHEKILSMSKEDEYLYKRILTKNAYQKLYNITDKDLLDKKYEIYVAYVLRQLDNYSQLIKEDYKKFIDSYIDKCSELDIVTLYELQEKIEDELINEYLVYPTGYQRQIPFAFITCQEEITNKKSILKTMQYEKQKGNIVYEQIVHDGFIQMQGLYANSQKYFINNIVPNFNRQVNDQNQMIVPINFSLPLQEIIAYITIIKNELNFKSPLELLEIELEKANDLTLLNTINENGKPILLDATRGDKPQLKLCDMLYIYDMKQQKFANHKIVYELDSYYTSKKITKSFNDKTIAKYYDIAKDYIENKRYKELITGKSTLN